MIRRIPGPILLWYSIFIFGAAGSIVRILADLGAQHTIDGRNAISFCNILFAGNMCAVILLFAIHHKEWTKAKLKKISVSEWLFLTVLAFLANCVAPSLFFIAIENTMVTNVVLISQIEPPLLLFLAWFFLKDNVRPLSFIGSIICLIGVALIVFLQAQADQLGFGKGEIYAALAASIYAVSTVIGRLWLKNIPLGIFSVFRSAVGTVIFFIIANYLFGPAHFVDLASPFLWKWMLVYGGIVILSGQLAWDQGIRKSHSVDVSVATSFSPVAGVLGAFLILGEFPVMAHYIGGGILFIGIIISLYASVKVKTVQFQNQEETDVTDSMPTLDAECRSGFKGV